MMQEQLLCGKKEKLSVLSNENVHSKSVARNKQPMHITGQYIFRSNQRAVMLRHQEGNFRSGVALTMHHRLCGSHHLRVKGQREKGECLFTVMQTIWQPLPLPHQAKGGHTWSANNSRSLWSGRCCGSESSCRCSLWHG